MDLIHSEWILLFYENQLWQNKCGCVVLLRVFVLLSWIRSDRIQHQYKFKITPTHTGTYRTHSPYILSELNSSNSKQILFNLICSLSFTSFYSLFDSSQCNEWITTKRNNIKRYKTMIFHFNVFNFSRKREKYIVQANKQKKTHKHTHIHQTIVVLTVKFNLINIQ